MFRYICAVTSSSAKCRNADTHISLGISLKKPRRGHSLVRACAHSPLITS